MGRNAGRRAWNEATAGGNTRATSDLRRKRKIARGTGPSNAGRGRCEEACGACERKIERGREGNDKRGHAGRLILVPTRQRAAGDDERAVPLPLAGAYLMM